MSQVNTVRQPADLGKDMPLIKLLRGGVMTLPATMRRKYNLQDGDYVKAIETEEGVLLKPVTVLDRQAAWRRIREAQQSVRYIGPEPRPTPEEEERWIQSVLAEEDENDRHA